MDKKKILSSLALAGILTANVLGANVNASTANEYLKPVGVYKKLIEGKTVVSYVLNDKNTPVTVKDVKAEFENLQLVNGTAITDENATLKTGNTFKANGTEYTVLVYGDANKDGKISTADALKIQKSIVYNNEKLDAIGEEVADIQNDGKISTLDALRLQKYIVGTEKNIINKLPEQEPEEIDSIYTVNVNDNGYVNSENESATKLKIKLESTLDEAKELKITVTDKENGKIEDTVTIEAHKDYIEKEINLSSLKDGNLEIKLLDDKEVVAKVTAEKNTIIPNATNVITNRISTKSATLSLNACGESGITKIYYAVVESASKAPEKEELVKTINVNNNSIADVNISNELETNKAYKVYYILENAYGSKSEMKNVIVSKDSDDVTKAEKVKEIIAPDLTKTATAEFTWTGVQGTNYIVTLYKDGKAVEVKTSTNGSGTDLTADFTTSMKEAGTYKIAVYAEGTEDVLASDVTESAEVKVQKLSAIEGLSFTNEDNKIMLTWKNSNNKDSFKEYKIKLYSINEKGEESETATIGSPATDKNEVEVTSNIDDNTIYIAKVVVVAKDGQMATINSDELVSSQFYKVGTPTIDSAETSENTVTLSATGIDINGKDATYKVKVFDVNESQNPEEAKYVLNSTKNVELKDGKILIDGLKSNKPYVFKLIASIDGEEVESDYSNVVRTLPELKNLTVVSKAEDAKEAGKVFAESDSKLVVGGKTIELKNYDYSEKLANSMKIINALKTGDVVSIDNEKVTLKLDGGASATDESRDLSSVTGLEKVTLEIESNKFSKTIKTSQVKEVILKGTDSIFNVKDVVAEKVTLTDGVEVVGEREYTVKANAEVIINGAKMSTEVETVVTAGTNALTIKTNEKTNNLVFENKKDTNLTISFEGLDNNTSVQSGSIVIKSNGGQVTVTSDKTNVNAELTVEVNSGDVDITEPALNGDKNITVTLAKGDSTTIKAVANTKAPVELDEVSVDITDEDLLKENNVTKENLAEVKAYLASFGLNGTGATITTGNDNEVTITFDTVKEAINNLTIKNIK